MQTHPLKGMTMTATTSHISKTSVNPMADLAAASGSAATAGNAAASGATTADAASIPKAVIHVGDKPRATGWVTAFPCTACSTTGRAPISAAPSC